MKGTRLPTQHSQSLHSVRRLKSLIRVVEYVNSPFFFLCQKLGAIHARSLISLAPRSSLQSLLMLYYCSGPSSPRLL